ncbi:MAG: pyridoxamine 5'-phosphate oxidase family protein [Chitinophagaceae bacterium]|nr:pyridoxamine 5'-phosphate oxidase family protein [Anaerolineae bacterium]
MATKEEKAKKVVNMLSEHKTTMLITHGKKGGLVSRPMTTQKPKFDGDVWFFVSSDADVIEEIEANPEVNISYSIEENYLSVSGTASIVEDDAKKKELWYPELKQWFDGAEPESSKVKLIKVSADTARYWDMSKSGSKSSKDESPIETEMIKY